ncbi:hypothetical protein [Myxococcus eversor]|uniref:hypothetical protein n=1 Tax=Myxococcus eversor TaxID=2709661 RepID=UPI0013D673B8|nr:hypothetical protein [Myxococcus eversor]
MLIVYQSLESVGNTDNSANSVLSGNSFKHRAQKNANKVYDIDKVSKKVGFHVPVFDPSLNKIVEEEMEVEFANDSSSKSLSMSFKKTKDEDKLFEFLEGVIDTIVKSTMNRTEVDEGTCRQPDIIVLGELHGKELKGKIFNGYKVVYGMNPTGDSRHRFTVLLNEHTEFNSFDLKIHRYDKTLKSNKDADAICMTLTVMGWLVAFVHTPNNICANKTKVVEYLKNNARRSTGEEELDLLIGDTNQKSSGFVQNTLRGELGGGDWVSSIHGQQQELVKFGGHDICSISGTNSGFDTHFDIACTRHVAAKIKDNKVVGGDTTDEDYSPAFVFHGLTDKFTQIGEKVYAYSDHNGVIVEILRRKDPFAFKAFRRDFILCRTCNEALHGIETLTGFHLKCPTLRITYQAPVPGSLKRKADALDPEKNPGMKPRKKARY